MKKPTISLIALAAVLIAATVVAAADQPAAADVEPLWKSALKYLSDQVVALALVLIFISAIISSYLSRRLRDRCLKHFEGYRVCLELRDGTVARGILDAENNGLELLYEYPKAEGAAGWAESSFIMYKPEYPKLHAILRYHDEMDEKEKKRRAKDLACAYHPPLFRRLHRRIRNFFAALKDAVMEAFTLVMGRLKSTGPQAQLVSQQGQYVNRLGGSVIGYASEASFDPLLEKQIGLRVLTEVVEDGGGTRFLRGVLKEYSKELLEVMDVLYPYAFSIALPDTTAELHRAGLSITRATGTATRII